MQVPPTASEVHFRKCEDNLGDSEGSAREGKMTCDLHALHAAPADARKWLPPALSWVLGWCKEYQNVLIANQPSHFFEMPRYV